MSPPSPSSASASAASLTGSELLNYVTEMSKSASAVAASDIHSACWNGDLDLVEVSGGGGAAGGRRGGERTGERTEGAWLTRPG
jgi:hypothetical protein